MIKSDPIADRQHEYEDIESKVHKLYENMWGEDPLWYNKETQPDCKYSIHVDDEEITIWNFVNGNERMFAREELDDPDFDIAGIFMKPEMSSTPTSTREGGYPILKNEDYQ